MACKGGTLKNGADKYYPNAYYKVGDLFLTTRDENPSLRFGGTWELFGKGKTLVCVDDNDDDFSTVKKTGGEKTHTLSVDEMPSHRHNENYGNEEWVDDNGTGSSAFGNAATYDQSKTSKINVTSTVGGGQSHNNLQPYITCYIWIRTA
ncbi:MAG: hypothetical protein SPJ27_09215 [Candidatus Onthovivens sp.]|nr:hypothetical protein [Candidatus Onthovivens sp.]